MAIGTQQGGCKGCLVGGTAPIKTTDSEANIFQTRSADRSTQKSAGSTALCTCTLERASQAHRFCRIAFVIIWYIDDCGIQNLVPLTV